MCGIAGVCGPAAAEQTRAVAAMLQAIAHRGPDGDGTHADPAGGALLGHKRLAIIDPEGGRQPLENEDGTVWVTFNGCIYNYEDIARELRQLGHRFKTHCDTEVIVHGYEQWGAKCVERFNGMFAFAVWDAKKRTLFCARDRVGVKPFYYVWDGSRLWFASEIKALLAAGAVAARCSDDGLRQYLTFQYCLGETTLFEGVRRLEPGHTLTLVQGGEPKTARYWDIAFEVNETHDEEHYVDHIRWLLQDSVRLRLRADVPLGAHLSGGLDSSAVVSLARMMLGNCPIKTFTGAFREGAAFDETGYAKIVAAAQRTEYMECYLGVEDFLSSIEKIIWHMDEPAAGPGVFPQYWVSKLASENVKVALGGQGGDEIFIGYARYLVAYLEECIRGAIENTAHRQQYVATLETIVPSLPSLERYVPMLKEFWREGLFDAPARRYFRLMDRFSDSQEILADGLAIDHRRTFEEFQTVFEAPGAAAKINRIMAFDLKTHLQALLQVEDRTSMAWGLESRVPLLDYRLIERMASIPPTIKFKNGQLKHLFRQAIKNLLPAEILDRKDKMGFPVPLAQWYSRGLRQFMADVLLDRRCRQRGIFDVPSLERALVADKPFSRSVWGALCLELWHRQFVDAAAVHRRAA